MNEITIKEVVALVSELKSKEEILITPGAIISAKEVEELKLLKIKLKVVQDYLESKDGQIKHLLIGDSKSEVGKEPLYSYEYGKKLLFSATPKGKEFVNVRNVHKSVVDLKDERVEEDFWTAVNLVKSKILTDELSDFVSKNTIPGDAGDPYGVVRVLALSKEDIANRAIIENIQNKREV